MPRRRFLLTASALVLMAGCARPRIQTTEAYAGGLMPRPEYVRVAYFAVSSDQVHLCHIAVWMEKSGDRRGYCRLK